MKWFKTIVVPFLLLAVLTAGWLKSPWSPFKGTPQFQYRFSSKSQSGVAQQISFYETKPNLDPMELSVLADLYYQRGKTSGDSSQFDLAETAARKSLFLLPSHTQSAKCVLAQVAQARHEFETAIRLAKEVLADNFHNERAMGVLATAYLANGQLTEASTIADTILTRKPTLHAYALHALILLAQGRDQEAEFDFTRALAVEDFGEASESAWVRTMIARHNLKRGRLDVAHAALSEALRIIPKYPLALDMMGQWEAKRGNANEAESFFNEAFALSRQVPYLMHLSAVKSRQKDGINAQALRAQAESLIRADLTGGRYGHRLDLVRLLLQRGAPGDATEAHSLVAEEIKLRPAAEPYYLLSVAFSKLKRWDEAKTAIQASLRTGVREAEYFFQAALVEKEIGNVARSEFYSHESQQLDPSFEPERSVGVFLAANP